MLSGSVVLGGAREPASLTSQCSGCTDLTLHSKVITGWVKGTSAVSCRVCALLPRGLRVRRAQVPGMSKAVPRASAPGTAVILGQCPSLTFDLSRVEDFFHSTVISFYVAGVYLLPFFFSRFLVHGVLAEGSAQNSCPPLPRPSLPGLPDDRVPEGGIPREVVCAPPHPPPGLDGENLLWCPPHSLPLCQPEGNSRDFESSEKIQEPQNDRHVGPWIRTWEKSCFSLSLF